MTYEAIVKKVKTAYAKTDASKILEHLAIQFNVTGEGGGAYYLEVADGKLVVEPYDYYDRDVLLTGPAKEFIAIAEGKKSYEEALQTGAIYADGNVGKLGLLNNLEVVKKAPAKKAAPKKTTAKAATKKVAEKTTEEKQTVEEKKTVAPAKVAAPKTAAPKTSVKKTTK